MAEFLEIGGTSHAILRCRYGILLRNYFYIRTVGKVHMVIGAIISTDGTPGRVCADGVCEDVEIYARHVLLCAKDGPTISLLYLIENEG